MTTRVVNVHSYETYDVYVGRPSKWGNPFGNGVHERFDRAEAVTRYTRWILEREDLLAAIPRELKDKILACYCVPKLCHGSILAMIADHGVDHVRDRLAVLEAL